MLVIVQNEKHPQKQVFFVIYSKTIWVNMKMSDYFSSESSWLLGSVVMYALIKRSIVLFWVSIHSFKIAFSSNNCSYVYSIASLLLLFFVIIKHQIITCCPHDKMSITWGKYITTLRGKSWQICPEKMALKSICSMKFDKIRQKTTSEGAPI